MKHALIIITVFCFASSCKKENLAPTTMINEMVGTSAILKYSGGFVNGPFGNVSGNAEVYLTSTSYELKLEGFNSTNGPALHVYLSKEPMPITFIDLVDLKSTKGNQV